MAKKKTTTKKKSRGLGDDIEKITEATGIKAAVKWLVGEDCGCDERKEKLNKLFPKKVQPLCLDEDEHHVLGDFYATFDGNKLEPKWHIPLSKIHARIFQHKYFVPCTCTPKEWNRMISELKTVYETYEDN